MHVGQLSVERRSNPLGIDIPRPRFAWRPDVGQSAYQLQVLDSDDPSASWSAPTWDSGRQQGGQSTYVAYAGPPLVTGRRYAWRVRAWAADQSESEWSEP